MKRLHTVWMVLLKIFNLFDQSSSKNKLHLIKLKLNQGDFSSANRLFFADPNLNNSNKPSVLCLKARLLSHGGDNNTALAILQKLCVEGIVDSDVFLSLGNIQKLLGQSSEAIVSFQQALKLSPESAALWFGLAQTYKELKDNVKALRCANKAIDKDLSFIDAYCLVGNIRRESKDFELAEKAYSRALHIDESNFNALDGLVWTLLYKGDDKACLDILEAKSSCFNAIELHTLRGNIHAEWCRYKEAEKSYFLGLKIDSESSVLWRNLGICLRNSGQIKNAVEALDRAIGLNAEDKLAIWHKSLCSLLELKFVDTWKDYEYRRFCSDASVRNSPTVEWSGEDLTGKCIFVYAEQGLGDEIMFASCINLLSIQVSQVIIECAGKLRPLFQRSFPKCIVLSRISRDSFSNVTDFSKVDYAVPIGSLPKFFLSHQQWLYKIPPYLIADKAKVNKWRCKLDSLGKRLKIGISWRGGVKLTRANLRSIDIEQFVGVFQGLEVDLVVLQYGDNKQDLKKLSELGQEVYCWEEALREYDETAALTQAVDLVVSVQTAIVHLAGAMGCKVWSLIPNGAEWRYGCSNEKMVWYKDVSLFRQQVLGEWDEPLAEVSNKLKKIIN